MTFNIKWGFLRFLETNSFRTRDAHKLSIHIPGLVRWNVYLLCATLHMAGPRQNIRIRNKRPSRRDVTGQKEGHCQAGMTCSCLPLMEVDSCRKTAGSFPFEMQMHTKLSRVKKKENGMFLFYYPLRSVFIHIMIYSTPLLLLMYKSQIKTETRLLGYHKGGGGGGGWNRKKEIYLPLTICGFNQIGSFKASSIYAHRCDYFFTIRRHSCFFRFHWSKNAL